jgi:type VI secretion system protein VasG
MDGNPVALSSLELYTTNLTTLARAGKLDPVLEREFEIAQLINVLLRRRQNNPILVGEPGVGKTAIVEGLASRIETGDVPPSLKNVNIHSLDIGSMLAGASVRGEFENRLKAVMKEVESIPGTIILFIDEAHMLIGAGGQADAANLLKPALARGTFKTIAATTHSEYRRHFEKDPAFARRFEIVEVAEPSEESVIRMLRPLVHVLEEHHGVSLSADAVPLAVRLSSRYMSGRKLPDKAIGVLDTSCARVATAQHCVPLAVTKAQQRVARIEEEIRLLEREESPGESLALSAAFDRLASAEMQFADLEDRWAEEKKLVTELLECKSQLQDVSQDTAQAAFQEKSEQLKLVAGELPLVPAFVDGRVVADVIADQTGIPVGQLLQSELHNLLSLSTVLGERVLGQSQALATISKQILIARTAIGNPRLPEGLLLLVGPSGVGKTETCLAIADLLYGGEQNATMLNMTEYQEAHSVSTMKGAPPGYVGYGESGILTEALRRHPYGLLLLDDIDKAHRDVLAILTQAFNKGSLEDSQGRTLSLRQTLVIMTSTAASQFLTTAFNAVSDTPDLPSLLPKLSDELKRVFPASFVDSVSIVPYYPLDGSILRHIVEVKLEALRIRIRDSHRIDLEIAQEVVEMIAETAEKLGIGARPVDTLLNSTVIPEISTVILTALAGGRKMQRISLALSSEGGLRSASS